MDEKSLQLTFEEVYPDEGEGEGLQIGCLRRRQEGIEQRMNKEWTSVLDEEDGPPGYLGSYRSPWIRQLSLCSQ